MSSTAIFREDKGGRGPECPKRKDARQLPEKKKEKRKSASRKGRRINSTRNRKESIFRVQNIRGVIDFGQTRRRLGATQKKRGERERL